MVSFIRFIKPSTPWQTALLVLVAFPVFWVGFGVGWWQLHQPPIVVIDFHEVFNVETDNQDLNLVVKRKTNEVCATHAARWLIRFDPTDSRPFPEWSDPQALYKHRVQVREIDSAPDAPPFYGQAVEYRLSVPIRPWDHVEPGLWHVLIASSDSCPASGQHIRSTGLINAPEIKVNMNGDVTKP